jgi:hypothetical protein
MFIAFGLSLAPILIAFALASSAIAETTTGNAPAVGVITAEYKPMAEITEINGRIQSRRNACRMRRLVRRILLRMS